MSSLIVRYAVTQRESLGYESRREGHRRNLYEYAGCACLPAPSQLLPPSSSSSVQTRTPSIPHMVITGLNTSGDPLISNQVQGSSITLPSARHPHTMPGLSRPNQTRYCPWLLVVESCLPAWRSFVPCMDWTARMLTWPMRLSPPDYEPKRGKNGKHSPSSHNPAEANATPRRQALTLCRRRE